MSRPFDKLGFDMYNQVTSFVSVLDLIRNSEEQLNDQQIDHLISERISFSGKDQGHQDLKYIFYMVPYGNISSSPLILKFGIIAGEFIETVDIYQMNRFDSDTHNSTTKHIYHWQKPNTYPKAYLIDAFVHSLTYGRARIVGNHVRVNDVSEKYELSSKHLEIGFSELEDLVDLGKIRTIFPDRSHLYPLWMDNATNWLGIGEHEIDGVFEILSVCLSYLIQVKGYWNRCTLHMLQYELDPQEFNIFRKDPSIVGVNYHFPSITMKTDGTITEISVPQMEIKQIKNGQLFGVDGIQPDGWLPTGVSYYDIAKHISSLLQIPGITFKPK